MVGVVPASRIKYSNFIKLLPFPLWQTFLGLLRERLGVTRSGLTAMIRIPFSQRRLYLSDFTRANTSVVTFSLLIEQRECSRKEFVNLFILSDNLLSFITKLPVAVLYFLIQLFYVVIVLDHSLKL